MDDLTIAARIRLECCNGANPECEHFDADEILIELLTHLGYTETVAAWEQVAKWYA